MATHSSILAWETPCTEEPSRMESTGSQKVRQDLTIKQQQKTLKNNYKEEMLLYHI